MADQKDVQYTRMQLISRLETTQCCIATVQDCKLLLPLMMCSMAESRLTSPRPGPNQDSIPALPSWSLESTQCLYMSELSQEQA